MKRCRRQLTAVTVYLVFMNLIGVVGTLLQNRISEATIGFNMLVGLIALLYCIWIGKRWAGWLHGASIMVGVVNYLQPFLEKPDFMLGLFNIGIPVICVYVILFSPKLLTYPASVEA